MLEGIVEQVEESVRRSTSKMTTSNSWHPNNNKDSSNGHNFDDNEQLNDIEIDSGMIIKQIFYFNYV